MFPNINLKIIHRDLRLLEGHLKMLLQLKWLDIKGTTVGSVMDNYTRKHPEKICFYFEDQKWTFQQVNDTSNKIGNYFASEGYKNKDIVSIYMMNCPEYVCTWLGLSKIGVISSLLNSNLQSLLLKHCLEASKSKAIVSGANILPAIKDVNTTYGLNLPIYSYGSGKSETSDTIKDLKSLFHKFSNETPKPKQKPSFRDPLFHCFTSGTTGLPKPAIINHSRFFMASYSNHYASELTENDIIYMPLPLYHVAGGMLGLSQTLIWGTPMVISSKFSSTNFWTDCKRYNATASQYIAEVPRYLLRIPPSPQDTDHNIRVMFGNGFRKDIWGTFVKRFNISKVTEFYASTEGNANMVNYDNTVGAVGVIPPWLEKLYPISLVRIDEHTGELIRDLKTGFLIRCKPDESGELIGKIIANSPFRNFEGYATNKEDNEKKLVRNVFKQGDIYFRTGDLLAKDNHGYYYFKDRMGDTFRWKSENVSTAEIEVIIGTFCSFKDCVVYGVKVPGYDGTAGMCTISDPERSLDIHQLQKDIIKTLPVYARPLFLRVVKAIETTGTHKLIKTGLIKDGFDLEKVSKEEKIYFLSEGKNYVPLTQELYQKLKTQQILL